MRNLLRNLFFGCGIIAALSFTVHQWATPALGTTVGGPAGVAFIDCFSGGVAVLRDDGRVFVANADGGTWLENSHLSPPVTVAQIAAWGSTSFIDTSGNGWWTQGNGVWTNAGPVPGGPTAVTPQTWSQIKGQYAPTGGGVH